jgi:hypothetical protein
VASLLVRRQLLGAIKPEHYLLPKNLSKILRGSHKREHG